MPQTKQEKPGPGLGERFKDFFKTRSSSKSEISAESLLSISAGQPISCRIQAIKELQSLVKEKKIQQNCIEQLWNKISDLLEDTTEESLQPQEGGAASLQHQQNKPQESGATSLQHHQDEEPFYGTENNVINESGESCSHREAGHREARHAVLDFLVDVVTSQYSSLDVMRIQFFGLLKKHTIAEDVNHRIRLLDALTQHGTNLHHFQDEIGPVLVQMLRQSTEQLEDCTIILALTVNLISHDAAHLSPDIVMHLIGILSSHACNTKSDEEVHYILDIYKNMVQHTTIPSEAILQFTACLCRVVNIEQVRLDALITMRSLLGTGMGQSSLGDLCSLIQSSPDQQEDELLIRGAVFFIGSCLWGPHTVPSLKYSTSAILPVFLVALKDGEVQVVSEVGAQVLSLVQLQGSDLSGEAWKHVFNVIQSIYSGIKSYKKEDDQIKLEVENNIKETIATIDELITKNKFTGERIDLFNLVETMCHICPQQSIIRLITFRSEENVRPSVDGWIDYVANLMKKFYDEDLRPCIRLRMLSLLQTTVRNYLSYSEDQILEKAVLPFLSNLDSEVDRSVRLDAVVTISELAVEATGSHQSDLIDILESILTKLTSLTPEDSESICTKFSEHDFPFYTEAVRGIVKVFKAKFFKPPILCVKRCYELMVTILDRCYSIPQLLQQTGDMRYEIFCCFLSLRARQDFHLGYHKDGRNCVIFSPFVVCESKQGFYPKDKDMLVLSLTRACRSVIRALKEESDWKVLQLLLNQVPNVLQNRGILLRYEESISKLAEALCGLVQSTHKLPDSNTPAKFNRTDFNLRVYPVLSALASYNRWLHSEVKRIVIKSLESGLLSKECSKVCTVALTSCILEMSDSMNTFLPEVLVNLSKISATVHVAVPVLEFLSTLISLPKVFSSFNNNQYMSVFAMTLPFTNPFKFNHYTVSLAHHVIIMWFLKCRIASRKDFVRFIVKGLEGNALQPFEEGNFRKRDLSGLNEDSSNRARSSSLNEESRPTRSRNLTGLPARPNLQCKTGPDERQALHTFHQELTQTCLDMMTRYCTTNPSLETERTALANILLKSGTSTSWIIDTAILTISVSGCNGTISVANGASGSGENGADLCQSCTKGCEAMNAIHELAEKKRYHSEQPVRSRVLQVTPPLPLVQDDALLHHQSNQPLYLHQNNSSKKVLSLEINGKESDASNGTNGTANAVTDDLNNSGDDSLEDLRDLNDPSDENGATAIDDYAMKVGGVTPNVTPERDVEEGKSINDVEKGEPLKLTEGQHGNENRICSCWCQGWCEILIRRPSGEISWMCQIRAGQLTSNSFSLADISAILFPQTQMLIKAKVSRSNSDPEILDKLTPLDLNRIKALQVCDSIPEEGNTQGMGSLNQPSQRIRARSNTIDSSSPTKPVKRMERLMMAAASKKAAATAPRKDVTPELMLEQLLRAGGISGFPGSKAGNWLMMAAASKKAVASAHRTKKNITTELEQLPGSGDKGGLPGSPGIPGPSSSGGIHGSSDGEQFLVIPKTRQFESSLRILDMIPYQETHKIGVIYVGHGDANKEPKILANTQGSQRYQTFLTGLGDLISLGDASSSKIFLGGLSQKDGDGDHAYVWLDDAMQVVYHTATLMPNRETDPQFNKKKRHIGNDYVAIVYNDSGETYQMGTVKGQFIYATVVVEPLDFESNKITVLAKSELSQFLSHLTQGKVVSDVNLSMIVRQIALHCNLAANIYSNMEKKADLYASNWLERLRHIKRLKSKVQKEHEESFMDYNII